MNRPKKTETAKGKAMSAPVMKRLRRKPMTVECLSGSMVAIGRNWESFRGSRSSLMGQGL